MCCFLDICGSSYQKKIQWHFEILKPHESKILCLFRLNMSSSVILAVTIWQCEKNTEEKKDRRTVAYANKVVILSLGRFYMLA